MTIPAAKRAAEAHEGKLTPDQLRGAEKYFYKYFTPAELQTYMTGTPPDKRAKPDSMQPKRIRKAHTF